MDVKLLLTSPKREQQSPSSGLDAFRYTVGVSIATSLLVVIGIATEFASMGLLYLYQRKPPANRHPYYQNQPWAAEFWREMALASPTHYKPFVGWKRAPFQGTYVNIDSNGLRTTVNPVCTPDAKTIWAFGSSTLWGTGVMDDQTIPSILSREYSRSIGPVCVTNFSEAGWMSTQNLIQLELALKEAAHPPDLVVFLDGYADVFPVYESGEADVHMDLENVRNILEAGNRSSFSYLKETGTYRLITIAMNKVAQLTQGSSPKSQSPRNLDHLAELIVRNYLQNLKLVDSLSTGYGFKYVAFWGPVLYVGNKPLSGFERAILESARPGLPDLTRKTYALMFAVPHRHLFDISDTFDHTSADIYLDLAHVTPDGNRLVALRMLETLKTETRNKSVTLRQ